MYYVVKNSKEQIKKVFSEKEKIDAEKAAKELNKWASDPFIVVEKHLTEEDRIWIKKARKDLSIDEISKFLKISRQEIVSFVSTFEKIITKESLLEMMKVEKSQEKIGKYFNLSLWDFRRLLNKLQIDWNELKKEVNIYKKEKNIIECKKCKRELPRIAFYKSTNKNGCSSWCQECIKKTKKESKTNIYS